MKLFLMLLLSIGTFAQNLTLEKGESVVLTHSYGVITGRGQNRIIVNGNVNINNLNLDGKGHVIIVTQESVFNIASSLNLNGNDTVRIGGGTFTAQNIELQNGGNSVEINRGLFQAKEELQVNDNTSVISVCDGVVDAKNFNINSAKYHAITLCSCSTVQAVSLNVNTTNPIWGLGSVFYKSGNINRSITDDKNVIVNDRTKVCVNTPLPVVIKETYFKNEYDETTKEFLGVRYFIEFVDITDLTEFDIETTIDGKVWSKKVPGVRTNYSSKSFTGLIKNPL